MTLRYVISILVAAFHALLGCVFAFILLVLGYPAILVQIIIWQNLTLRGVVFATFALWPWRVSQPDGAAAPHDPRGEGQSSGDEHRDRRVGQIFRTATIPTGGRNG